MDFNHPAITQFLKIEQALKAESTMQNRRSALKKFEVFIENNDYELEDIGETEIKMYIGWLSDRVSDLTASQYLTAVSMLYNEMYDRDPLEDINTGLYLNLTRTEHTKRTLEQDEVSELVDSAQSMRGRALLSLMASTGMRLKEACNSRLSRLNLDERYVDIMTVKTDFGRRDAYFDRKTRRILDTYINGGYREEYEHTDSDYIFLSKAYGQYDGEKHISTDRGRVEFNEALENSDIDYLTENYNDGRDRATITSHILRRSFCQHWIDEDGDLYSLKNQVGWMSVESARDYISDSTSIEKRDRYGIQL